MTRKPMHFFVVNYGGDVRYFTSKEAAKKDAQETADFYEDEVAVSKWTAGKTGKALILAILNEQGWAAEQIDILTVQPRKARATQAEPSA